MVRKVGHQKKLSDRQIIYHIDTVQLNEETSKVLIQGWAVSKSQVMVTVDSKFSHDVSIQKCPRTDVMDYFHINEAHVGFVVECPYVKKQKYLTLAFMNEKGKCIKVRVKTKKKNKIFCFTNIQHFY
ncbi:MAG TPA: hypothetical protein DCY20_11970, partial [Firmicutes bacterium]|nr:hypothetical protein [Bacillota bacterium]